MATILAWLLCIFAIGGICCMAHCCLLVRRWSRCIPVPGAVEPVSLLKPLYGAEPRLAENLSSFLDQDWGAPIEMICGIQRESDPALSVVVALQEKLEDRDAAEIVAVCDSTPHGPNAKIANLISIAPSARHDLIVTSDSDIAVPRNYLTILSGALAQPGVGAVTCLYRGRGDAGRWSQLAAAVSSYHFLPIVLFGLSLRIARPCMGSTIAMRRGTLTGIGGFEAFTDQIADDYDIGQAVRALGLKVAIPPLLLVHAATDDSLAALWRHELRWAATLKAIDPAGNAGVAFTYPLPFALALVPLMPRLGLALVLATLGVRFLLKRLVDRWAGESTCPFWMLPARDLLSFAVFLRAFVVRSVDWRGARLTMASKGRIVANPQTGPMGRVE